MRAIWLVVATGAGSFSSMSSGTLAGAASSQNQRVFRSWRSIGNEYCNDRCRLCGPHDRGLLRVTWLSCLRRGYRCGGVADLENGILPIYEPGLAELIVESREAGRLRFSPTSARLLRRPTSSSSLSELLRQKTATSISPSSIPLPVASRPFSRTTLWLSSNRRWWRGRQRRLPTSSVPNGAAAASLSPQTRIPARRFGDRRLQERGPDRGGCG